MNGLVVLFDDFVLQEFLSLDMFHVWRRSFVSCTRDHLIVHRLFSVYHR